MSRRTVRRRTHTRAVGGIDSHSRELPSLLENACKRAPAGLLKNLCASLKPDEAVAPADPAGDCLPGRAPGRARAARTRNDTETNAVPGILPEGGLRRAGRRLCRNRCPAGMSAALGSEGHAPPEWFLTCLSPRHTYCAAWPAGTQARSRWATDSRPPTPHRTLVYLTSA